MFKKLKEKITEEVKSSPQRFQQLTQSVSDRLQNSAASDENFFSIGEDDANTSNASIEPGFSSVPLMSPQESKFRRNSNSSVNSDASFLPRYESLANMYHLQSDLDVSASEIEDNASNSSQLGHLSKEQIYSAFQKAQMRYHKYRGRYTDLAKHYKDLERENSKMKSVLVETQDKAIRRVTELKEQCTLEQKAKAHLESALRDEMDEKQLKIQSLETKIGLLQNGASSQDTETLDTLNRYLTDARTEIENLNERIQEMKANSIIFQTKEQDYRNRIASLEKEISQVSEREKENNLTLAQNKMELHNELLSKDSEINNLKKDNELLKQNLESITTGSSKLENLQTQNKKLIEKLENLTQKCNAYETDLLKMEQYKIELQSSKTRLKETEEKLQTVRDDAKKHLLGLEAKIREKIAREFEEKEESLKVEFQKKLEEISSNAGDLQEIQLKLIEKDGDIKKLKQVNERLSEDLAAKTAKYDDLERNHLELIEDSVSLRNQIGTFEKEISMKQNENQNHDLKISRLESAIKSLEDEIEDCKKIEEAQVAKIAALEEERGNLQKLQTEHVEKIAKLEDYKQKLEMLEDELKKERQSCEEEKDFENKLKDEKQELLQKLKESEDVVKKLEETSCSLTEEIKKKNEEIALLQSQNRELEDQVKILTETNASFNEQLAKLPQLQLENEDLVKKLEETNSSLTEEFRETKNKIEEIALLRSQNQKLEDRVKILTETNASFNEQLAKLPQLQLENEDLVKKLEETNSSLTEEFRETKNKIEEIALLRSQNQKLEDRVKILTETNASFDEQLAKLPQLQRENEDLVKKLDATSSSLTEELTETKNKIEEISLLRSQNHKLAEQVKILTETNASLGEQLEDENRKREDLGKKLEEITVSSATKELTEIKKKNEEIASLQSQNQELEDQVKILTETSEQLQRLEEENRNLRRKLEESEEEEKKLVRSLEAERQIASQLKTAEARIENLEKINLDLNEDLDKLRNLIEEQKLQKEENEAKFKNLEETINGLNTNQSMTELSLKQKDEEIFILKEEKHKLGLGIEDKIQILHERDELLNNEMKKFEEEKSQLLEEVNLIKKLLEETNNNLTIKEHEINKFVQENEDYQNRVHTLEKKIEEYNNGFLQIFTKLPNNFRSKDKNLQNLEEKLQNFEHNFSLENDNLSKILIYLKQFEEKYSSVLEEKDSLLAQLGKFENTAAQTRDIENELVHLRHENTTLTEEIEKCKQNIIELESRNSQVVSDSNYLSEENQNLVTELTELKINSEEFTIRYNNSKTEIESLRNAILDLEAKLEESASHQLQVAELERHLGELQHEKQLLQDEVQELKIAPLNLQNSKLDNLEIVKQEKYVQEIENLRDKLTQYKSLDLTNRSSIEFYENELQKLKNQNEKLNRKLDETLVTLTHCTELSNSTEIEYLRNVLYNYMLGKESLVLARVIAAVCKFDPHQTETILAKEQQKQTLLGQLGIL